MKTTSIKTYEYCYDCPYCGNTQGWSSYGYDEEDLKNSHNCDECHKDFMIEYPKTFSVSDVEQLQKDLFNAIKFKPCLYGNKSDIESRRKCNCYYCKQEADVIEVFNNFKGK